MDTDNKIPRFSTATSPNGWERARLRRLSSPSRIRVNPCPSVVANFIVPSEAAESQIRVAHLLRKYNPAEWGGTESAVQRLVIGLGRHGVESLIFCPRIEGPSGPDPLAAAGGSIRRFRAFLPVFGLSAAERRQHVAVGGNLMSLDLPVALLRQPGLSVLHTHALGRLGGIALFAARRRSLPLVVTIHGGFLDLPDEVRESFRRARRGWEWGKVFGCVLRSRQLLRLADAVLTCNPREAALLREQFPGQRVIVQPHGVATELYADDVRAAAGTAFPQICGREVLLCVGRLDPVKNQDWLVEAMPAIVRRHPRALLVLAGACTDQGYGESLRGRVRELGMEEKVLFTGGLPPGDPRLIGLFQEARVVLLPSVSETFGLVLLEAWASGTAVISSRTSGASALVKPGVNGWLFDLDNPGSFHEALDLALGHPDLVAQAAAAGKELVRAQYDTATVARRLREIYEQLLDERTLRP